MTTKNKGFLERAYDISSIEGAKDFYKEWSANYDNDLAATYRSPTITTDAIVKYYQEYPSRLTVPFKALDAGVGTGLVGELLVKKLAIAKTEIRLEGLDISPDMLEQARQKQIYQVLEEANLEKRIDRADSSFDLVLCVGTLTQGHVGASAVSELARVTKKSGLLAFTVMDSLWSANGFEAEVEKLVTNGNFEVYLNQVIGFHNQNSNDGRLLLLHKLLDK